jgi:hypothetical protein
MKPATDYRNNPTREFYVRYFEERGIFLEQARYQRVTSGLFEGKMPTYADYGGWVISIIGGWVEVIAAIMTRRSIRPPVFARPTGKPSRSVSVPIASGR